MRGFYLGKLVILEVKNQGAVGESGWTNLDQECEWEQGRMKGGLYLCALPWQILLEEKKGWYRRQW